MGGEDGASEGIYQESIEDSFTNNRMFAKDTIKQTNKEEQLEGIEVNEQKDTDANAGDKKTDLCHKDAGDTPTGASAEGTTPHCCINYHMKLMKMMFGGQESEFNHNIIWGYLLGVKVNQMPSSVQVVFKHETDYEAFRAMTGEWCC